MDPLLCLAGVLASFWIAGVVMDAVEWLLGIEEQAMVAKAKPEIHVVTDCRGELEHEVEIQFTLAPGVWVVRIGDESYHCRKVGDGRYVFAKPDKTEYQVRAIDARPGFFGCTCPDATYRSQRGTKSCKHCQAAFILKESQA